MDDGNYGCGIFVGFQKVFDFVDHSALLKNLERYGIRGISNKWFASYLSNSKQFVSMNEFDFYLADIKCAPHPSALGAILGPLLFLVYINDLYCAIKSYEGHHFAD